MALFRTSAQVLVQPETQKIAAVACAGAITQSVSNHQSAQRIHRYARDQLHSLHNLQPNKEMYGTGAQQAKDKIQSNRKVMIDTVAPVDIRLGS